MQCCYIKFPGDRNFTDFRDYISKRYGNQAGITRYKVGPSYTTALVECPAGLTAEVRGVAVENYGGKTL